MKFICIHKDLAQLTFLGISNCYLVRERDGFTLVDCTISGQAAKIIKAAQELGGSIRRILLTHAHVDHIGSLDQLHALLGPVDVAISQRESPFLHRDLSLRPDEPQQKVKGGFPGATTRPTHTLTEGELFGSLRCIATPGHTPGHFSFLDERDGTLFAGDALTSIGGLHCVTASPWYFPLAKMATWDFALAEKSAQRLLEYKPKSIATGHGSFISNGTEELSRLFG